MVLNNMKKIVNGIEIELTQEEIAQRQLDEQQAIIDKQIQDAKIAEQQANKQSALNKLKILGLNDAEINAILGL
jgi:replicative DNA helicase